MPRYTKKIVKTTEFYSENMLVRVVGEGWDEFELVEVDLEACTFRLKNTNNSSNEFYSWKEPFHKITDTEGNHVFDVVVGECDDCASKFPDSCSYYTEVGGPTDSTMICNACWDKREKSQEVRDNKSEDQKDEDIHPTIARINKIFFAAKSSLVDTPYSELVTPMFDRMEQDILFCVVPEKEVDLLED